MYNPQFFELLPVDCVLQAEGPRVGRRRRRRRGEDGVFSLGFRVRGRKGAWREEEVPHNRARRATRADQNIGASTRAQRCGGGHWISGSPIISLSRPVPLSLPPSSLPSLSLSLSFSLSPLHLRLERLTCLSVGYVRVDHFFDPPCARVSELVRCVCVRACV